MTAPTFLGSNYGTSSAIIVTTTGAIPAGALAFVAVRISSGALQVVSSVSDGTNSYTKAAGETGTYDDIEIWICPNASGVLFGTSVTVNLSGAPTGGGAAAAFVGYCTNVVTSAPANQIAGGVNSGSATNYSATTGTLSQASEVAIGLTYVTGNATETQSSGFTNLAHVTDSGNISTAVDYQVVSSTTAITYDPVWSVASRVGSLIVTFKFVPPVYAVAALPMFALSEHPPIPLIKGPELWSMLNQSIALTDLVQIARLTLGWQSVLDLDFHPPRSWRLPDPIFPDVALQYNPSPEELRTFRQPFLFARPQAPPDHRTPEFLFPRLVQHAALVALNLELRPYDFDRHPPQSYRPQEWVFTNYLMKNIPGIVVPGVPGFIRNAPPVLVEVRQAAFVLTKIPQPNIRITQVFEE